MIIKYEQAVHEDKDSPVMRTIHMPSLLDPGGLFPGVVRKNHLVENNLQVK